MDIRSLEREAARLRRAAATAASVAAGLSGQPASSPVASNDAALMRYFNDPTSQALLQWVRAACAPYALNVNDFMWSLSDGRALCYLVRCRTLLTVRWMSVGSGWVLDTLALAITAGRMSSFPVLIIDPEPSVTENYCSHSLYGNCSRPVYDHCSRSTYTPMPTDPHLPAGGAAAEPHLRACAAIEH